MRIRFDGGTEVVATVTVAAFVKPYVEDGRFHDATATDLMGPNGRLARCSGHIALADRILS
jgi:hypothetical protein